MNLGLVHIQLSTVLLVLGISVSVALLDYFKRRSQVAASAPGIGVQRVVASPLQSAGQQAKRPAETRRMSPVEAAAILSRKALGTAPSLPLGGFLPMSKPNPRPLQFRQGVSC